MRWRFVDPNNRPETAERDLVVSRIDAWWREFETRAAEISALFSRRVNWDLPEWMAGTLEAIRPGLRWEYGPAVRGGRHRLVITPESRYHLRPLVRAILERAPVLDGWEFYEHRLPEDLESTKQTVLARTECDIADFKVRVSRGSLNRIDLQFASAQIAEDDDPDAWKAAFVATETLLGEQCLDHWIGSITIIPMPRKEEFGSNPELDAREPLHFLQLDRLKDTVDALKGSMVEQLPPNPHHEWAEEAEWTIWKLKPERAAEYFEQDDMFVGKSANPPFWTAAHQGGYFSSARFSRCGETFCYVKLDGSEGLDQERFADKSEIEDALNATLRPHKLGCYIGGGTGLRYSYIDLALTDVEEGIQAVRRRLQDGNVPKRSWIQFFDSDWAAEWVGIYDDSPPPPMSLGT